MQFRIFLGHTFFRFRLGRDIKIGNLQCVYIFRKAGSNGSMQHSIFSTEQNGGSSPINTLQILSDKDEVIIEMELEDDEESFKAAFWMQEIFQVHISNYMGRELEIIPPK